MRRNILLLAVAALLVSNVAAVNGGSEPVKIQLSIDSDKYRLYPDSNRIGFPALMREEPVKYKNASYKQFAKWEVSEKGVKKVEEVLNQKIADMDGLSFGSGQGEVTVEYLKDYQGERGFSYSQLISETPSKIKGTVQFGDEKVRVSIPVKVSKATAPELSEAYRKETSDRSGNISANISRNISLHLVAPRGNISYEKRLDQVINTVDSLENIAPNEEDEKALEKALKLLKSASAGKEKDSRTRSKEEKTSERREASGDLSKPANRKKEKPENTQGQNQGILGKIISSLF